MATAAVGTLVVASFSGLFWFLASHDIDRRKKPKGVDWAEGSAFTNLLVLYIIMGFSTNVFYGYIMWLCSTFTNDPLILSRYSGYIEGMKALGLIVAFAIDSNKVPFLTEAAAYFSLAVIGIALCGLSARKYTQHTRYGEENTVIVPRAFEQAAQPFPAAHATDDQKVAGAVVTGTIQEVA